MANLINDITGYIEELCRKHAVIKHTDTETHFVNLATGAMAQKSRTQIFYPVVTLEKLENSYAGQEDSYRKKRTIELMFLDKVSDSGDFARMNAVWEEMEWVAEDFLRRIRLDRRDRTGYSFLKSLKINSAQGYYVENVAAYLWGYMLTFDADMPFLDCIQPGRFTD